MLSSADLEVDPGLVEVAREMGQRRVPAKVSGAIDPDTVCRARNAWIWIGNDELLPDILKIISEESLI